MDIDATRQRHPSPRVVCSCCGKVGHAAPNCWQGFDVRHMTLDEKRFQVEQLLAQLDVADSLDAAQSNEGTAVESVEEEKVEAEDFQKGSE
ncbi:hypothetical protein LshimejAT787_1300280 [Lyophyllum shimeji]|uniref:CCHC-type domain-containing protein n=1 Tax=Lyophyllum shimeji TaxID=47721 RepID=A0A9P3PXM9_LYOSH|nr:hypothetical protein LshimejAT787_1300280 [Lyophyllum shimeji]